MTIIFKNFPGKGITLLLLTFICLIHVGYGQSPLKSSDEGAYKKITLGDGSTFEVDARFQVAHPIVKLENENAALPASFSSGQVIGLHDGRLLLIYPNSGKLEATFSSDGGNIWTKPQVLTKASNRAAIVQTKNGTIWAIFYKWVSYDGTKNGSRSDLYGISSADGGKTWSDPQIIWRGYTGMTQGMIETRKGTLVMPFCYVEELRRYLGACVYSRDGGKSWQTSEGIDIGKELDAAQRQKTAISGGTLEPSIVQLKDGRLLMVMRTIVGKLWHCYSKDDGATWSQPEPMSLTCGGPVYITRLMSGRLAMVWNEADWNNKEAKHWGFPYGYDKASISLSNNEGKTWTKPVILARNKRSVHSLVVDSGRGELLFTMPGKPLFLTCKEDSLFTFKK